MPVKEPFVSVNEIFEIFVRKLEQKRSSRCILMSKKKTINWFNWLLLLFLSIESACIPIIIFLTAFSRTLATYRTRSVVNIGLISIQKFGSGVGGLGGSGQGVSWFLRQLVDRLVWIDGIISGSSTYISLDHALRAASPAGGQDPVVAAAFSSTSKSASRDKWGF